MKTAVTAK